MEKESHLPDVPVPDGPFNRPHFRDIMRKILWVGAAFVLLMAPSGLCIHQQISADSQTIEHQRNFNQVPEPDTEGPDTAAPVRSETSYEPVRPKAPVDAIAGDAGRQPFHKDIMQAARTYQVDPALIKAIIMAESNYNPQAVSSRGAQGLMQLMPATAKWLGVADAFDPALNIDGGVRYFRYLLDRCRGDVELALAAYNAGIAYVLKYDGIPPFDTTQAYVKKVLAYHQQYQREMASIELDSSSV